MPAFTEGEKKPGRQTTKKYVRILNVGSDSEREVDVLANHMVNI